METIKLIEMVIFISRCVLSFPLSRIKPKSLFNYTKMSESWNEIVKSVETKMRSDQMETEANCGPRQRRGMTTSFPVRELTLRSLEEQTSEMKTKSQKYRLTIDPWFQYGVDLEAMISVEIWQELQKVHRHVSTVGELHQLLLIWGDVVIDLAVISISGGQEELKKHPTFLKINSKKTAVTAASFPVNLMRIMGGEEVEGPTLHQRFLYYTLAAREVVGDITLHQFIQQFTGTDINALIRYLGSGNGPCCAKRPSIEQAGFNTVTLKGASRTIFDDSPLATINEAREGGKKRRVEGAEARGEASKVKPEPTQRRLFEDSDATEGNVENGFQEDFSAINNNMETNEEKEQRKVQEKARFLLKGGWDWSLFSPEEYHIAIPMARRRGILSLPADLMENLDRVNYVLVDENGQVQNTSGQALEDPDVSMRTETSNKSPRAELSLNTCSTSEEQLLGESGEGESMERTVDLTESTESSGSETIEFSPFLAKPSLMVVNVSSSSSSGGEGGDSSKNGEPSLTIQDEEEEEASHQEEENKEDDSVIFDGEVKEESSRRGEGSGSADV